jgi:2',3'-cyclic-nucleotide 2'-phosphodiesterase (5'-nucleotidase family)
MTYSFDPAKPPGSRILSVQVGGRPLEKERRYKVATNEYIYGGGDGYAALARGKALIGASGGPLLTSMVIDYIARQGQIAPRLEARITRAG